MNQLNIKFEIFHYQSLFPSRSTELQDRVGIQREGQYTELVNGTNHT